MKCVHEGGRAECDFDAFGQCRGYRRIYDRMRYATDPKFRAKRKFFAARALTRPGVRERKNEKVRERRRTDPKFRAKDRAASRRWGARNRGRKRAYMKKYYQKCKAAQTGEQQ